jgi:hypothetical protein
MASLVKMGLDDEEIRWRIVAWMKFAGAQHVVNYVSHMPKDARTSWVLSQGWGLLQLL